MNKYEFLLKKAYHYWNEIDSLYKFAKIRKLPNGKYRVYSEKGKNLGTYDSHAGAKKRLRQVEFFKHRDAGHAEDHSSTDKKIDLTDIEDFSLSAILRKLRQQVNKEQIKEFLELYKKKFDMALKKSLQKPERLALNYALIQFHKKYNLKINPKFIKNASISELGDPMLVGKYLSNIVRFTINKMNENKRQPALQKLKDKFLSMNPEELSKKYLPETSSIGQSITFVKHVLFNQEPSYIRQVLQSLSENLN